MLKDFPVFAKKVGPERRDARWAHHHRRSSGRVQVQYTYHSDPCVTRRGRSRDAQVFTRTFNKAEEYALWWVIFRDLVTIGGEVWPRILCGRKAGFIKVRKSGKQSLPAPVGWPVSR